MSFALDIRVSYVFITSIHFPSFGATNVSLNYPLRENEICDKIITPAVKKIAILLLLCELKSKTILEGLEAGKK